VDYLLPGVSYNYIIIIIFIVVVIDTNHIQLYKFPDLVSCLFVFVLHVFFFF
jgi:hypothetical protein